MVKYQIQRFDGSDELMGVPAIFFFDDGSSRQSKIQMRNEKRSLEMVGQSENSLNLIPFQGPVQMSCSRSV
jgi:hypothetical protein